MRLSIFSSSPLLFTAVLTVASAPLVHCGGDALPEPRSPATAPTAIASVSAVPEGAPPAPAPREDGRLPALAKPIRYAVSLEIDPAQPRFRGQTTILVDVPAPTRHLILHGRDMMITRAHARANASEIGGSATTRVAHGGLVADELVITFDKDLPAGQSQIEIAYDAPFATDLAGLYRVKDGERWYAFTQFESTDARRAFPCFDEPSFKAPFDVSITAPRGTIALSNMPESARKDLGRSARFDFATTPPLPSYLVAFAVGDFDVRAGASSPAPIRLITTKGKSQLGDAALAATQGIAEKLGAYFDVKYPFAKLDIVAVPELAAGAMENPGLITFREELLLQEPGRAPVLARQRQAMVIAHELAHIWVGDLVTTQWWNDIWLNEGFATWMEAKVTDEYDPHIEAQLEAVADTQNVMDTDALTSARAVRQPVSSANEAAESFDDITYQKGSAVLRMIEHWVGEEPFRRGVREYIKSHAWKNAKADDLLSALDRASGRDVTGMAATFLDRSGVPSVAMHASCAKQALTFDLKQAPWHPLGLAPRAEHTPWKIPVCIRGAGTNAKGGECTDLATESGSLASHEKKCPAWSFPNAGEAGYYRFSLPEAELMAIARGRTELDVPSRIGFVSNVWAQVRAGELSPAAMLDVYAQLDGETNHHVVAQMANALVGYSNALVSDAARPRFRAWVTTHMAKRKARLGWVAKPGEDPSRALERRAVLGVLGNVAEDDQTLKEAEQYAKDWLKDPKSVDSEAGPTALLLASRHAGQERLDELRAALKKTTAPLDRVAILTALGGFADPAMEQGALDLILTDEVRRQDLRYVLRGMGSNRAQGVVALAWMKEHWDTLRAKLPGGLLARSVDFAQYACTKAEHDDAQSFFAAHAHDVPGAARPLAEALERSSACIELSSHGTPSVDAMFAKAKAKP